MSEKSIMTFNGIQIGDFVDFPLPSIRRISDPEVQSGVFQKVANVGELGANVLFEDKFLVCFEPDKGNRDAWDMRDIVKDWLNLFGNVPARLTVSGGGASIDEAYAVLVGIDRAENPANISTASFGNFWFTFWYKESTT